MAPETRTIVNKGLVTATEAQNDVGRSDRGVDAHRDATGGKSIARGTMAQASASSSLPSRPGPLVPNEAIDPLFPDHHREQGSGETGVEQALDRRDRDPRS